MAEKITVAPNVVPFTNSCQEHQLESVFEQADFPALEPMLITDDLLLFYKRCRRRAFLDIYGDPTQQDPEQDFLLKLRQESRAHQQAVLAIAPYQSPNYSKGNWEAGAKQTLELMQQGAERISKGILLKQTEQGVTLLSRPDLLIKQSGQSIFGDWMYVPTHIKLGRRPKAEYQIVAAFSAHLLEAVQGVLPSTAGLILRTQEFYRVSLERWMPIMQDMLSECTETLVQCKEPEVFISRQRCSLCQWYSSCYAIAQHDRHISLLPGVTPSRYQNLQAVGVTTVESLAESTISTLEPAFGSEVAFELVQQAQSTVQNRAILRQTRVEETEAPQLVSATNTLPTAPVELYFDIEAEPELQLDYLLGVLVRDRYTNSETFHPLLAEHPRDEVTIWQQFLDLVLLYPDAPIFHFSEYEVETVKRLAKLYNTPLSIVQPLLSRFVDVHQRVVKNVTLPVESYSLKNLAKWLGFEWRDPSVTGSQCVCLYDRWLETGDRSLLYAILRYNEDDCRATYQLKNWLSVFLQTHS